MKFKLSSINSRELAKYRYLKTFALQRLHPEAQVPTNTLEVLLTDGPEEDRDSLSFTFFGVTDLRVVDLNAWLASAIQIDDISAFQLEGSNFRVTDTENAWFSLNCEDLDVRVQASSDPSQMQLAGIGTK